MISKKLTYLTFAAAAGLGALAANVELASAGGWGPNGEFGNAQGQGSGGNAGGGWGGYGGKGSNGWRLPPSHPFCDSYGCSSRPGGYAGRQGRTHLGGYWRRPRRTPSGYCGR